MENGSSSGSGFVRSDKVAVAAETVEAGGGLGLKLQRTESFPYRMMIRHHQHRPFSFSQSQTEGGGGGGGGGGSGGGDGGPTYLNGGNEEVRSTTMSSIYDCAGAGAGSALRTLQPFNATTTAFVSSGDMAASLGFPFTQAQWNELHRQAMIYKYMMASAPVPPDLLISATRNFSDTAASYSNPGRGSFYNLRFSNNTDPEPGRCRRTDGKKWRCSRDVAPDQKYCERHMHRGRPRSRKPVEVHTQINTINSNTNKTPASATPATAILPDLTVSPNAASSQHLGSADPFQQPLFYQPSHHEASPLEADISASSYKEPRYLEWMMKGETSPVASSNQQWQQLMPSKFGLTHDGTSYNGNAPSLQQHYQEPLSLNSYTEFGSQGPKNQQHNDEGCLFVSTEDPRNSDREQTPRRFIDAWSTIVKDDSTGTGSKSSVTSSAKLSLSSLALSMSGGRGSIREDMDHIQMGLGINDSDPNRGGGGKSQALSWMNSSPVSWMASPPGGPLAEALGTGTTGAAGKTSCAVGLNLMSDSCGGSPQATTMSSPSGVITRTLASLSDSSGSSSPTLAAAAVSGKPDTALQWLSRTKLESS